MTSPSALQTSLHEAQNQHHLIQVQAAATGAAIGIEALDVFAQLAEHYRIKTIFSEEEMAACSLAGRPVPPIARPPLPQPIRERADGLQAGGETMAWRYLRSFVEGQRIQGS